MFFGVPNMQHFTETNICPFLGLFFEHTIFLNKENISYLLHLFTFKTPIIFIKKIEIKIIKILKCKLKIKWITQSLFKIFKNIHSK
jgi:hypothetical protein